LTQDIDCSDTVNWNDGKGFEPILEFRGSFDGQGYEISNLYINRTEGRKNWFIDLPGLYIDYPDGRFVGLFAIAYNATIENVGLVDADITGNSSVGGLVGTSQHSSTISNSYTTGVIEGDFYIGGMVGMNTDSKVLDSYSTASMRGITGIGGLAGLNSDSVLNNTYATGAVEGEDWGIGGLVGQGGGDVSNSYATGTVKGEEELGGLIGSGDEEDVESSYWDIEASGMEESDGGTGLTTDEMQTKSTFTDAGWDFEETWYITENNYPDLQWNK